MDKCEVAESSNCDKLHNCHACHTEYHCGWQTDEKCYTFVRESSNIFSFSLVFHLKWLFKHLNLIPGEISLF